ncbi:hypothetical protein [Rickettsia endosymbiont of Polydrusus tereticollis]
MTYGTFLEPCNNAPRHDDSGSQATSRLDLTNPCTQFIKGLFDKFY